MYETLLLKLKDREMSLREACKWERERVFGELHVKDCLYCLLNMSLQTLKAMKRHWSKLELS